MKTSAPAATVLLIASSVLLAACGGGGGGSTSPGGASAGTLSGAVVLGPVAGATVRAYALSGGTQGALLGEATADAAGRFDVSIGHHAGPVMVVATGGSFVDEATGASMALGTGDALACAIPSVAADAATAGIHVTPLTSMARARAAAMPGGMTEANVAAANAAVGAYFQAGDVLRVAPMDPTAAGAGAGATQDERAYGMALAAMSQEAMALGMTSSAGMATALAADASDGVMDGMMGATPVSMGGMGGMSGGTMEANAGTAGLADAMHAFLGSARNRSGLTADDLLACLAQLSGSGGQLPGAGGSGPGQGAGQGTMTGTAFMGAMSGGTVTAYAVSGGARGQALAAAPLGATGAFSVGLGAYAGPVMLEVAGATYEDEATGISMPMASGDVLTACVPSVAAGATTSGVQVTPLTTMAQARAQAMLGGMTTANAAAANAGIGSYFMAGDVLGTMPMDPAVAGSGTGATQDQRDHGMAIAAMSEYAHGLGMTGSTSAMATAMAEDASDGVMNGMMGGTAIPMGGMGGGGMMGGGAGMMAANAGTTGLSGAMTTFAGSAMNRSGVALAAVQPLVNQLAGSNGTIP
ncbi:hypothetical protein A2cp1_0948 [Anaeromyxobacter dehalogenans 2CP-1]|uniref:Uncharacterized protein n=1 Tax=Anaeromyxobacter dehalogenans (strain ATCC BAA-258 / DSM 21875 / 2CP-1) TaxID=455488 RepID=B8JEH3_ANAD2|nr:hypothetical protein [Anaeromyxobacter dehalogenans]ACL64299.1 hypothetical protein A2cp1_0948 [Anaeromyxobacter dehalogenans 2CP-1]